MQNCPYCGQPNPEEQQVCRKCGADMANAPERDTVYTAPSPDDASLQTEEISQHRKAMAQSVWEKRYIRFVLYFHSVLCPPLGLVLGILVSMSPFQGQKALSAKLIVCACIACIVWLIVAGYAVVYGGLQLLA